MPPIRPATAEAFPAGYPDRCPFCQGSIYLPVAGSKDSKAPVRCPHCEGVLKPEC